MPVTKWIVSESEKERFLTDDPERAHCSLRWTAPDSLDKGKDVSFETMVWTTTGGYLA